MYCFWAIPYRGLQSFHEQFQLFQLTGSYFSQHLAWPGGMASYIGEFLVQFYNNYWIGAAIIAMMMLLSALLANRLCNGLAAIDAQARELIVPGYICATALWLVQGDIALLASFNIAMLGSMALAIPAMGIKSTMWECAYALIAILGCYWLFGTTAYLLTALICLIVWHRKSAIVTKGLLTVLFVSYLACWIIVTRSMVPYSTQNILIGINYYRMMAQPSLTPLYIMAFFWIMVAITPIWMKIGNKANIAIAVWAIFIACILFPQFYDRGTKDMVDYSAMVRTNDWHGIIARSAGTIADKPMTVCATNLALAMTGQIGTRLFDFYQNTAEGLIPPFTKEANTTLATAELYFHLGLINTAQRLCFEAMESIPNFAKSSRCVKRLTETALIRGDYALARKYLGLLENTLFYKKWAQRTRKLIDNPVEIAQHPLYGKLRSMMINDDFLFSEYEMDKILGQLFLTNPNNGLARDYLLLYPLLNRDLGKFMQYMDVVQTRTPYMPPIIQQGVAFAYMQNGQEIPQGMINPAISQQLGAFARAWTTDKNDATALQPFKNTLWSYLLMNNE